MRLLVCGASGFIGRNMFEHFEGKYDISGTCFNSGLNRVGATKVDLTNKICVNDTVSNKDIIIQAAATTSGAKDIINKPYYHVTDNAIMNSLIFRAAFEHKVKHVIFFSCSTVYKTSEQLIKETDLDLNSGFHQAYFGVGWTKTYIEKLCEFYSKISDTKYTVIRHSNIYGPYDKFDLERSHVFGATMTKVMTVKDKIVVWGNGEEKRDLLYVSDLVDFVDLVLKKQESKFEIFNVGYGSMISVSDLVKKIITHSNRDIEVEYDLTKPTIKTNICLDTTKANMLGWEKRVTLDQGINNTIKWFKDKFQ